MTVAFSELAPASPQVPARDAVAPTDVLRVGLMGFGRTGREVAASLLRDPATRLEWVVRRSSEAESRAACAVVGVTCEDPGRIHSTGDITADELLSTYPVDIIIDFSSDSGIAYYGSAAADHGVAIVTAISHYSESRQRELRRLATSTRVLWSPNITLGACVGNGRARNCAPHGALDAPIDPPVAPLKASNQPQDQAPSPPGVVRKQYRHGVLGINFLLLAAQSLQRIAPHVDVAITEEHFRDKAGVSGTALRLAHALNVPEDDVHTVRSGGIIGVHEVLFGFPDQTIRLRHEAMSREAFGHGAAFAARQLVGRERGYYRMEDLLLPYFATSEEAGLDSSPRRGLRGRLASKLRAAAQRLE